MIQFSQVIILFLSIVFITNAAASKVTNEFTFTEKTKDHITIKGTKRFVDQVVSCLSLLENKDAETYTFINKYIGVIKQHHTSGMDAAAEPPTFEMSSKTAFYSLTWCASSIAHDAKHSYLYQKYKNLTGSISRHKLWMGKSAEGQSIHFQRLVSEKIGAPNDEIMYLLNLKGSHSDLNGDGKLTHDDYKKRDW